MTERIVLNRVARATVALELGFARTAPLERAAIELAYTLCRVVVLGTNSVDQTEIGSARLHRSKMTLSRKEVEERLRREFKAVMRELKKKGES